jgi:hypothetical protein
VRLPNGTTRSLLEFLPVLLNGARELSTLPP